MSLVISHNFAASYAARQLEINDDNLRNSLNKLSSGKRIVRPTDDAAGMAVQLKMKAAINRGFAAKNNIQNAISFLQTQDGVLTTAAAVIDRIGELRAMATDATKNSLDLMNYDEEFQVLREQLIDLQDEKFNGVRLFVASVADHGVNETDDADASGIGNGIFTIYTTEQGSAANAPTVDFEGVHLGNDGTDALKGGIGGIIQHTVDDQYAVAQTATTTITGGGGTDTFNVDIDGNSLLAAVVWNNDVTDTAADLVTAINGDATLSTLVTASSAAGVVTLTAATSGTAFTQGATTVVDNGGGAAATDAAASSIGLTSLSMDNILADLQGVANARAKNGALQSRLGYAYDNASVSKANMEAARSRIIDVDIAEESTKFATYNILTQASASILAQANQTGRTALQLLMN